MKRGFYVSPDGKTIILICTAASPRMRHILSGVQGKRHRDIDTMFVNVIRKLFGSWTYLGKANRRGRR